MHFAQPEYLFWLWALVPLAGFLWWAARRTEILLTRFLSRPLVPEIGEHRDEKKARWKNYALTGVFLFSVAALARPQWGFQIQEIKRQGVDIILVVDTSRSMLTEDVKPNRLERTKLAIRDFLKKLKGDRVGLVAFAGDAFLVCPLTVDYEGFLLSLEDLSVETIPRGGTNIAAAVKEALREYDSTAARHKAVVILTDGENLEDDPMPMVQKAKEKGVRIFCVGIGTREGELVRAQNHLGVYEFLKDDKGNFVKSRLNEKLLQEIASTTGGVYARASGAEFGLELIYDRELSRLEKRDIESKTEKRYFERFQVPLAVAMIFLVMESLLTTRKKANGRSKKEST